MSKKTDMIKANLIKKISKINDEQTLIGMAIFAGLAVNDPIGTKAKIATIPTKKAPKAPKSPTPAATESRIIKYKFNDKDMLAFQSNGKPDEAVLAVCKGAHMRFYKNVPSNPFNNTLPFWAGKASDELEAQLMAVA